MDGKILNGRNGRALIMFKKSNDNRLLEFAERAAKAEGQLEAWKDRGDRYAAHNDKLQQELMALHQLQQRLILSFAPNTPPPPKDMEYAGYKQAVADLKKSK